MIQDIKPHQFHNEFRPHPPTPDSRILNYHDRTIMVKKTDDHQLCFPTFQNLYENGLGICEQYTYLFSMIQLVTMHFRSGNISSRRI